MYTCLQASTVVVGGGPAGLATAIMLARRGWNNIQVLRSLLQHTADSKISVCVTNTHCLTLEVLS